jgi:hypothetical protein
MLWEIILDDDVVVNKNREEVTMINNIFLKVAQQFYDKEKGSLNKDLIQMNKKFITIIVNILNQNFPKPKPIVIHTDESIPITAEEIHKTRANEFENEFNKKQEEFTRAMAVPVPEAPNFLDNAKDEPISDLDSVIKRTIAERNMEIQKITSMFNNEGVENWIKSSETSINAEKNTANEISFKNIKIGQASLGYENQQQNPKSKHITWAEELVEEPNIVNFKINELQQEAHVSLEKKIDILNIKFDLLFGMVEKVLLENFKIDLNQGE